MFNTPPQDLTGGAVGGGDGGCGVGRGVGGTKKRRTAQYKYRLLIGLAIRH